jgi:hypothetical protein
MKQFSVAILDDEHSTHSSGGWSRVFKYFLNPRNYLITSFDKIALKDGSTKINSTDPFEVHFFKPELGYDKIVSWLDDKANQKNIDIYFIDMDWSNPEAIEESKVKQTDLEDITIKQIGDGEIPSVLAGLNILNILSKDKKPKIVFSGSDRTGNIRKVFALLSNRVLTDDILIGELNSRAEDSYIDEIETRVDEYLQSRQIEVISRQNESSIQLLNKIIKNWVRSDTKRSDEALIPDDGISSVNENRWSLRSLFPKQVNQIEQGKEIEENKKCILSILNNKFPDIVFWLLFNHGEDERGTEIDKLTPEEIQKKLNFLDQVDFSTVAKKAESYIKLSNISDVKELLNKNPNERGCHLEDLRTAVVSKFEPFEIYYQGIGSLESNKNFERKDISNDYLKKIAQYGIYIGDLVFIKKIAEANKYHCNAGTVHLNIKNDDSIGKMEIEYLFNDADRFEGIESIGDKIQSYFESKRYFGEFELRQLGIEDLLEIMVKRYNSEGKIQIGKKSVSLDAKAQIDTEQKEKASYKFILNSKNTK